jgi:hypothetical protein
LVPFLAKEEGEVRGRGGKRIGVGGGGGTLIKNKTKFSSHIRKCRWDPNVWEMHKYFHRK